MRSHKTVRGQRDHGQNGHMHTCTTLGDFTNYHVLQDQRQVLKNNTHTHTTRLVPTQRTIGGNNTRQFILNKGRSCRRLRINLASIKSEPTPIKRVSGYTFPILLMPPFGYHMAIDNFCLGSWHCLHSCGAMLLSLQLRPLTGTRRLGAELTPAT